MCWTNDIVDRTLIPSQPNRGTLSNGWASWYISTELPDFFVNFFNCETRDAATLFLLFSIYNSFYFPLSIQRTLSFEFKRDPQFMFFLCVLCEKPRVIFFSFCSMLFQHVFSLSYVNFYSSCPFMLWDLMCFCRYIYVHNQWKEIESAHPIFSPPQNFFSM